MFKKVIYNTGAQIVGKAITASTTLLVTSIIGRSLGSAGYGEFTKIFVFVGYFYTLVDFGLNSIYIKLAKEDEVFLLKKLVGLRLIMAFVLFFLAILISFFLPYNSAANTGFSPLVKTGVIIVSVTIVTHGLFTTANAYFQKNLRYDLSTIAAICGSLVILAVTIGVTTLQGSLLRYTLPYVAGGMIFVAVALFLIFKKSQTLLWPTFSKETFVKMLSLSWPVGVALIFNLVYFRIDVFILANFRSSHEVGLYGLAYQFFEAALAIPIFFANAIYPLLNKLFILKDNRFGKVTKYWLKILGLVGIVLAIFLFFIAFAIPIIISKDFQGSIPALQILAIGMPFFFISAILWHLAIIYDKQKYLIYVYGFGAIFNLITNLALIPIYGYIAASIVTVVSEFLVMLFLVFTLRRLIR